MVSNPLEVKNFEPNYDEVSMLTKIFEPITEFDCQSTETILLCFYF